MEQKSTTANGSNNAADANKESKKNAPATLTEIDKLITDQCISSMLPINSRDATKFSQKECTSPRVRDMIISNWDALGIDANVIAAYSTDRSRVRKTFLAKVDDAIKKDTIKKLKLQKKEEGKIIEDFDLICTPASSEDKCEKLQNNENVTKFWCGKEGILQSLNYYKGLFDTGVNLELLAQAIAVRCDAKK